MREIKFRGKRINTGEWVHGGISFTNYHGLNGTIQGPDAPLQQSVCVELTNGDSVGVDPETVGEYTGLKDKQGKEICEGDVVKHVDAKWIGRVQFRDGTFEVVGELLKWNLNHNRATKLEIIGNIHEHPHLIKEA